MKEQSWPKHRPPHCLNEKYDERVVSSKQSEKQANLETPNAKAAEIAAFKASASATRTEETEGRDKDPLWISVNCALLTIHPRPQAIEGDSQEASEKHTAASL
ncbi:predicted protein [Arabidopsis lyrata subsp. lyrata]|uniref:Predicted protein n=1 Tax=Arabidopsis lyrata subsp. lyrata TaxID=81972 RepID=D7MXS1_ARALL|nr:predicted protein [Arabidopsis lyrata subsp. lyrata]